MELNLTIDLIDLAIFLIIAFIAGTAASYIMVRRGGRSAFFSLILGMIGAFIGQYLFNALDLTLNGEFFNKAISIADISIAFFGAILILLIASGVRRL